MKPVKILAEVGSNWYHPDKDEARKRARDCIDAAARAGAYGVKFQYFQADTLYSQMRAPKLYANTKKFELPIDWIAALAEHASDQGLEFWMSVFDYRLSVATEIAQWCDGLKVASGDITYLPLVESVAAACEYENILIMLSAGAATADEIYTALDVINKYHVPRVILMQCVIAYPAEPYDYNLSSMLQFYDEVDEIGVSDHTTGFDVSQTAAVLGYTWIERHFRPYEVSESESPDWGVSLGPDQLDWVIKRINTVRQTMGDGQKVPCDSEKDQRLWARRGSDGLRPVDNTHE